MKSFSKLLKFFAFLTSFSPPSNSDCFLIHGSLKNPHSLRANSEPSDKFEKIVPADEEVVKKLIERHKSEIQGYLNPLESGLGKPVSEKDLEEAFGKPLTRENIAKRQASSRKRNPYHLPDTEPTTKLPYFVNLQFPSSETGQSGQLQTPGAHAEVEYAVDYERGIGIPDSSEAQTHGQTEHKDLKDSQSPDESPEPARPSPRLVRGLPIDTSYPDPLRALINRNPPYPQMELKYGPKWYLPESKGKLTQVELEDGWSILPCGKVYKHILQPSELPPKRRANPDDESCVTFKFKMLDAQTNTKIADNHDIGGPMVTTYMQELGPVMRRCLKGMNTGEQAEFVFHVSEYNPDNMIVEELTGVTWLRLWLNLWESHNPNDRWWGLGPGDAHLYPKRPKTDRTKLEVLEEETDRLTSQIQTELCSNPTSPLWQDVLEKMNTTQKESYVRHFDKQLERVQRMKHSEFTGSRAFSDKIVGTGQLSGYDVGEPPSLSGNQVGGVSKFIVWRETPFMMYVAVRVIPGVRAEHVTVDLAPRHLVLKIADRPVIDDDLSGSVDLDTVGVWAMSDAPTVVLGRTAEYDAVSREPCVMIFLKKTGTSVRLWGVPFVNT